MWSISTYSNMHTFASKHVYIYSLLYISSLLYAAAGFTTLAFAKDVKPAVKARPQVFRVEVEAGGLTQGEM